MPGAKGGSRLPMVGIRRVQAFLPFLPSRMGEQATPLPR
jgi:hypothetical protein